MAKILLVSTTIEKSQRVNDKDSHYPIGLGYLHSYLESVGHSVQTLFLNNLNYKTCLNSIEHSLKTFKPTVVGLQILSFNRVSSFNTIEYIEKFYPNIKIVIGGIHATICFEQILKKYPKVIACLGEGELTLAELVSNWSDRSIKGIAYSKSGIIIKTLPRELIANLDILPFPKHASFIGSNKTLAGILTSRGCPYKCSFCCLNSISQNKVRYRSPKNVVDEIEYITINFPLINQIWIHDDSFFLNNKRVIEICNEIVSRKIKISISCSGRLKPISKEMVDALVQANVKKVMFGLESGSKSVLERTHKKITKEDVIEAIKLFKDTDIVFVMFMIVGLPGETDETIQESIDFIQQLQLIKYIYYDDVGVLLVYPGTEVYEMQKAAELINNDFWMGIEDVPYYTAEHSKGKLIQLKDKLRNGISVAKIGTIEGFLAQYKMMSVIQKEFNVDVVALEANHIKNMSADQLIEFEKLKG